MVNVTTKGIVNRTLTLGNLHVTILWGKRRNNEGASQSFALHFPHDRVRFFQQVAIFLDRYHRQFGPIRRPHFLQVTIERRTCPRMGTSDIMTTSRYFFNF